MREEVVVYYGNLNGGWVKKVSGSRAMRTNRQGEEEREHGKRRGRASIKRRWGKSEIEVLKNDGIMKHTCV